MSEEYCETCDGTGEVHSHNPSCWDCNGTGKKHDKVEDIPLGSRVFSHFLEYADGPVAMGTLRRNSRKKGEPQFKIVQDNGKICTVWKGVMVRRAQDR